VSAAAAEGQGGGVTARRANASLLILAACCFFETLDLSAGAFLIDPIRHELHLTDLQMGLALGTAFGLAYALSAAPIGLAIDRLNRTRILLCGLVLWTLAVVALAFVQNFPEFLALEAVLGAVTALLLPTTISLISDFCPPERRAFATSGIIIGQAAGGATAFLLGGVLLDLLAHGRPGGGLLGSLAPWRLVYLLFAVISALLTPIVTLLREPPRREVGTAAGRGLSEALRELLAYGRLLIPFYLAYACTAVANNAVTVWVAPALSRAFGSPMAAIGGAVGVTTVVANILGALMGGPLAEACRRRRLGLLGLASLSTLIAAPFSLFALAPGLGGAVLAYGVFNVAFAVTIIGATVALTVLIPNELRGLASGILVLLGAGAGRAIAPAAVALVQKSLPPGASLAEAIGVLAIPCLLVAAGLFFLARRGARGIV